MFVVFVLCEAFYKSSVFFENGVVFSEGYLKDPITISVASVISLKEEGSFNFVVDGVTFVFNEVLYDYLLDVSKNVLSISIHCICLEHSKRVLTVKQEMLLLIIHFFVSKGLKVMANNSTVHLMLVSMLVVKDVNVSSDEIRLIVKVFRERVIIDFSKKVITVA